MTTFLTIASLGVASTCLAWMLMRWRQRRGGGIAAVKDLTVSAKNIESLSVKLKQLSSELNTSATHVSENLQVCSSNSQVIKNTLNTINAHAKTTQEIGIKNLNEVSRGVDYSDRIDASFDSVADELGCLKKNVEDALLGFRNSSEVIQEISTFTASLNTIVFQAKLLSFNASIEAASAGEAGKGFTVVAKEIGQLAVSSERAASEINKVLSEGLEEVKTILGDSEKNVHLGVANVMKSLDAGRKFSRENKTLLETLVSDAKRVKDLTAQVASEVASAYRSSEELSEFVSKGAETAAGQKALAKVGDDSTRQLGSEAESLNQVVTDLIFELTGKKIREWSVHDVAKKAGQIRKIDVRREEEFNDELGHLAGAELITIDDSFESKLEQLNKKEPLIMICRSGGRSARACRIAYSLGFTEIYNMTGGMLEWQKAGLPTERNKITTKTPAAA